MNAVGEQNVFNEVLRIKGEVFDLRERLQFLSEQTQAIQNEIHSKVIKIRELVKDEKSHGK